MHKKTFFLMNVLFVASVLLAACATPTKAPVTPTATRTEPAATTEAETVPVYKDPEASVEDRVKDLLARMTLAEKIGQMTQVEKNSIRKEDITARFIGSLLSGGGGYPGRNTPEGWADMVNGYIGALFPFFTIWTGQQCSHL
jgi:beta-glucosidase